MSSSREKIEIKGKETNYIYDCLDKDKYSQKKYNKYINSEYTGIGRLFNLKMWCNKLERKNEGLGDVWGL